MAFDTGMVFHSLFRAHHNAIHAGLSKLGVGDIGSPRLLCSLMECESRGETPSQRELADLLHVSPATIAISLKSLERNGYVVRSSDPSDSRRNIVSVTPKAMKAMEESRQVFADVDTTMFAGFSEEEVALLNSYHQRMTENLYAIGGDQDAPCPAPSPNSL